MRVRPPGRTQVASELLLEVLQQIHDQQAAAQPQQHGGLFAASGGAPQPRRQPLPGGADSDGEVLDEASSGSSGNTQWMLCLRALLQVSGQSAELTQVRPPVAKQRSPSALQALPLVLPLVLPAPSKAKHGASVVLQACGAHTL